jgi:tRNA pseudouridine38-40 synthase
MSTTSTTASLLLELILREKDTSGSLKQLEGTDLSRCKDGDLETYVLFVKKRHLDLSNSNLTKSQLKTVISALNRRSYPIQTLNLSGNTVPNDMLPSILSIKNLGGVYLSNVGITTVTNPEIRTSGKLHFLDLRKNNFECGIRNVREIFRKSTISRVFLDDDNDDENHTAEPTKTTTTTRYVVHCSYDGTDFSGWQAQTSKRTIQETIEKTLTWLFKSSISIVGSGRTDAGVHARHQVFHFDALPFEKSRRFQKSNTMSATLQIQRLMNIHLPRSIRIKGVYENSSKSFHARKSVKRKRYVYTFRVVPHNHVGGLNEDENDVFLSRAISDVRLRRKSKIDLKEFVSRMFEIVPVFRGEHDFTAFAVMNHDDERPVVRNLSRCDLVLVAKDSGLLFRVILECDFFLYNMCRRIVGFMLEYAHGNDSKTIDLLRNLLRGPSQFSNLRTFKKLAGDHIVTAEAKGLRMDGIYYDSDDVALKYFGD